jgi:hypothetical protein
MNEPSKRTGKYKISAIEQNKKGQMVVSFGAEKLLLSPNAFTEMPLYVGKELTASQYRSLVLFTQNEVLWNYALSLRAKGLLFRAMMSARSFGKRPTDEDTIRQLIFTLKQQGLDQRSGFRRGIQRRKREATLWPESDRSGSEIQAWNPR